MPHLLNLPNELLLLISTHLPPRSFSALLRTNQQLHTLLAPTLPQFLLHGICTVHLAPEGASEPYHKLYWASLRGHPKPLQILLETRRLNVNARTHRYSVLGFQQRVQEHTVTALHLAAVGGRVEVAKLLLDHGAEVDARETRGGKTALLLAAENANERVAELLVRRGADVNAKTDRGGVLDAAILGGMWELAQVLVGKGARSAYMGVYNQHMEVVRRERGALYDVGKDLTAVLGFLGFLVGVGRG
ncbi:ankyrin repeat-containing domain protein [Morchella snyderi]|nr:ankyrin repeat-containing domain protein [Morchella snyderi]